MLLEWQIIAAVFLIQGDQTLWSFNQCMKLNLTWLDFHFKGKIFSKCQTIISQVQTVLVNAVTVTKRASNRMPVWFVAPTGSCCSTVDEVKDYNLPTMPNELRRSSKSTLAPIVYRKCTAWKIFNGFKKLKNFTLHCLFWFCEIGSTQGKSMVCLVATLQTYT